MLCLHVLLCTVLGWPVSSVNSQTSEDLRWTEAAYGISLSPPGGSRQWEGPAVLWAHPAGYTVRFELIFSDVRFNLEQAAAAAVVQMGFARSLPRLVAGEDGRPAKPRPGRIADRPAIKMYFDVTEDDGSDWLYGQAIVMLEPHAAAVLKLNAPRPVAAAGQADFERVLDSMVVPLASELDRQRAERIEAAGAWLRTLRPENLHDALPDDQFYRLVQRGQDVGYRRVGSTTDPAILARYGHEVPGVLIRITQREYLDGRALDTEEQIFAADAGDREVWSHRATLRPRDNDEAARPPGLPSRTRGRNAVTWTQTGMRGDRTVERRSRRGRDDIGVHAITVIRESPPATDAVEQIESHELFSGKAIDRKLDGLTEVDEWQAPEAGYLSQAMRLAYHRLLPNEAAVYHFTAYHTPSGRPGLRTVEVVPQPDGGKLVRDRPTPRQSPMMSYYDADGRLIRRVLANGLTIEPTTPQRLAEIWDIPLPR